MNLPTFTWTEISLGFKAKELREIERLVSMNRVILVKTWEEFHG
jgi:hypothetical protein